MTQYGILNLALPLRRPRGHETYQTEVGEEILDYINRLGFEEAVKYVESEDSRKLLVRRDDYNNSVLINFPCKSGGHFFGNCLSLSSDIRFVHEKDILQKLNWLKSKYNEEDGYWHDVCIQNSTEVDFDNTKYWFLFSHTDDGCAKKMWDFWTETNKMVLFKNKYLFVCLRKCVIPSKMCYADGTVKYDTLIEEQNLAQSQLAGYAENNKERKLYSMLSSNNVNLSNYRNLSIEVKNKLKELFNDKKPHLRQNYSFCNLKTRKEVYFWDVNWYLDEKEFLDNMESFYRGLDLNGYDRRVMRNCYRTWMNAMYRCLKYF